MDASGSAAGRRRVSSRINAENETLDQIAKEAEERLVARRRARAEAREERIRELERQQKKVGQNSDASPELPSWTRLNSFASPVTRTSSMSLRRSSEESLEEEGRSKRDMRHELKLMEERFRKVIVSNAQLDNECASRKYQAQILKDQLEEGVESYAQLQREIKEKVRHCNDQKRNLDKLNEELKLLEGQLEERDKLIALQGLVIITIEDPGGTESRRALVTVDNAHLLSSVQGSLDVRLKNFNEDKRQLSARVRDLEQQLLDVCKTREGKLKTVNGITEDNGYEVHRESNKIISDCQYKLQKAEFEVINLQASLSRSEMQAARYKSLADASETAEAELKAERRKLQRENREAMGRIEELETSNNNLLKRLDKLKGVKSALLKEL